MTAVRISIIAAVAENGVIGAAGALPWRLSTDMQRFKRLTIGKPVVMGRKTFESLGKPLAGRRNIVVTRDRGFAAEGIMVFADLDAALAAATEIAQAEGVGEVVVIGGGEIYRQAMQAASRLYITHVAAAPAGDARFPEIDPAVWRATSTERFPAGPRDSAATSFVVYERVGAGRSG